MRSLRSRLVALWLLSIAASLAVAMVLLQVSGESRLAQAGRADLALARACDLIADRFAYFAAGWAGPEPGSSLTEPGLRSELTAVVTAAQGFLPVETGMWQSEAGVLVPEGLDSGLRDAVGTAAAEALQEERHATLRLDSGSMPLIVRACPLPGPITGLAGFALLRQGSPGSVPARLGLAVLAGLALAVTLAVGAVLVVYSRRIGAIEAALSAEAGATLPRLPLSGERDLDRVVVAFNDAGERLARANREAALLGARMATSERLAALGRVAAGVAHEIRNPIAAMRLRAENALAGDDARRRTALEAILGQISRLDRLSADLLDMTRPRAPARALVHLPSLLAACVEEHRHAAAERTLVADGPDITLPLDAALLRRALDNLVQNALQATPPGGEVGVTAKMAEDNLVFTVADTGPGIPEALRARLFEPFVTGRADGTGLGLAIAREVTLSLGGALVLADPGGDGHGAVFTLTIPGGGAWPAS